MANKILWYGKEVEKKVHSGALTAVLKACVMVQRDVQVSMKHVGGGREYPRPGGKTHKASAPGEVPVIDYGRLVGSISYNWKGSGKETGTVSGKAESGDGIGQPDKDLTGYVGTRVEYAKDLELGNAERNLEPRPFLIPALERNRGKIKDFFMGIIK